MIYKVMSPLCAVLRTYRGSDGTLHAAMRCGIVKGGVACVICTDDALQTMPDETLLSQMRDDPRTVSVLLERYRHTVVSMANSYAANAADAEDFAQEGLVGLLAAISAYDEKRAAGFRTFAAVCIRNRIRSAARRLSGGAGEKVSAVSLDDPENDLAETLADSAGSPEQVFLEKEHISALYAKMSDVLSRQEQEIFCLSVSGYSFREIADRLGISVKSVDNAMQRARRKLRAAWS